MNNHSKSKINNKKILLLYYISLIPLIIYSIYKHGIIPYNKHLINFITIFKPLYLIILSIIITIIVEILYNKIKHKKQSIKTILNSYEILYSILLPLILPINTSILLYIIIYFILSLIFKLINQDNINKLSIIKLLIIIVLIIFNKYSYMNIYESNIDTAYNVIDLIFGKSISGIATSNAFLLIISYIILCFNPTYKKNITFNIIITYIICLIISSLFGANLRDGLKLILSNELLFASIYIATIPMYSPIRDKEQLIYSILIGILSFFFIKFTTHEGVYISILISNIIYVIYDKIASRKSIKNV